jgi:polygalacturonase
MNDIMAGKLGKNPQDVVYTPYFPYSKGLDFSGLKNLTVEANGATLMCSGWMEPVSLEYCEDITIEGLTIDYKTIPHSEGKVIKVEKEFMDVELSDTRWLGDNMIITRIMFWDLKKNRLLGNSVYPPFNTKKLDDNIIRIFTSTKPEMLGMVALMNHTMHFRPAILINEAKNTVFQRVTIHSQPGMGIVGHRSQNVLMEGLRIVPAPGKYQSTNTDATHFTSCTGLIRFDGCMFEGQGDDATNMHGYYHKITNDMGNNTYEIKLEDRWSTHACVLDFPDVGNTIEIVKKSTLEVIDSLTVLEVDTFPKQWRSVLKLSGKLPDNYEDYFFIDVTRLPRLEFVNTYVGSHLARAVLVKTRNVLIENCTMRESTGTAIHIGAEGDWHEGAGSQNVIIRNNRILRCGRGDGTNDGANAIAINVKAPDATVAGIHKNIIIEGNLIEGDDAQYGISVSGTEDVMIRNNVFSGCKTPVNIRYSTGVKFENNYSGKIKLDDF